MFRTVLELHLQPFDDVPEEVKDAIRTYYRKEKTDLQFWFDTSWYISDNGTFEYGCEEHIKIICNFLLSHNVIECYIST